MYMMWNVGRRQSFSCRGWGRWLRYCASPRLSRPRGRHCGVCDGRLHNIPNPALRARQLLLWDATYCHRQAPCSTLTNNPRPQFGRQICYLDIMFVCVTVQMQLRSKTGEDGEHRKVKMEHRHSTDTIKIILVRLDIFLSADVRGKASLSQSGTK